MKRFILFVTLIFTMATTMAQTKPTTHCFVEGKEPLYLDHYRAEGEGLHPCVLFAFGGGFAIIPFLNDMIDKYHREEEKSKVNIDYAKLDSLGVELIESDLLTLENGTLKHDSLLLSTVVFAKFYDKNYAKFASDNL